MYGGPEVDIWSCGVILFALLVGYLPFDDQNVNILYKKIKAGYFKIPTYLSEGVTDLLRQLLQADPVNRITIQQIKDHKWFQQDLPEYLFPESNQDSTSRTIDPAVVSEVCQKLGVKMQEVVEAIQNGDSHNQLFVAYNLVLDNMMMTHPVGTYLTPSTDWVSTVESKRFVQAFTPTEKPHKPSKPQWPLYAVHTPGLYPAGFTKCRWHLGIQSQSRPQDIMAVIFHKMKGLNYYWKIISPYHLLVKYDLPNKESCSIKLDLQLYQVDKRTYLLDIKDVLLRSERSDLPAVVENCGLKDELKHMQSSRHYTMEFFETSSLLIQALVQ